MTHALDPSYFFDLKEFAHAALFKNCRYVWEALKEIEKYLKGVKLGEIRTEIPLNAFLIDAHLISIGEGTVIEPGAYIKGPCIIGKNCSIRHGAYIRGGVVAGDSCVIGHDTEMKNAILLNHTQAAHFAYVGDSILGNHVNLGAGTKCANLKLDHRNIEISHEGQRIDTGLRKFGAIIGDHASLGCNSVTNPGTLIGQNVLCYPCINFGGFIASDRIIKSTAAVKVLPRRASS